MEFVPHISDSAFLVNESRARRSDLSGDGYAQHWVVHERRERVRTLWNDFSSCVYPFDDIVLSIRNRFFLERMQAFVDTHADPAVVNLGAGFTSYPFLLDPSIRVLEVDFPHVVAYKQSRIKDLTRGGILPARDIQFCGVDLTSPDDWTRLELALAAAADGRPSFILMEGLTYYLDPASLNRIFDIILEHQSIGSRVAFDYWPPELAPTPVFNRLRHFFETRLEHAPRDYNLLDEGYVRSRPGYTVAEHSNVVAEETRVLKTARLRPEEILFEHYAILTRT